MPTGIDKRLPGGFDELGDPFRQAAAVGVAEHHQIGPGFLGGFQGFQGIIGIRRETVEEMLGIVNHLAALRL